MLKRLLKPKGLLSLLVRCSLCLVLLTLWIGLRGGLNLFTQVPDHAVAVVLRRHSGDLRVVDTGGTLLHWPFFESLWLLDKSPREFHMRGNEVQAPDHVPRLLVRSADASSYVIQEVSVVYGLIPEQADKALVQLGTDPNRWARALDDHLRPILRDELGRFSTAEIGVQEVRRRALDAAQVRLAERLAPLGLALLDLRLSNPSFGAEWDTEVNRQKVAEQEIQRLQVHAEQLNIEKEQRLAKLSRKLEQELSGLGLTQVRELSESERASVHMRVQADMDHEETVAEAEARREELLRGAELNTERIQQEAAAFEQRTAFLAELGEVAVREALIETLTGVEFRFVPYSQDGSPERLEVHDTREARQAAAVGGAL